MTSLQQFWIRGQKWPWVARNDQKWSNIVQNGKKWWQYPKRLKLIYSMSPMALCLAKNLENKVFLAHTIKNFTIWNPNVAPKKVTILGPMDTPWHPPGVQGGPKCIPSSLMMTQGVSKKTEFYRNEHLQIFPRISWLFLLNWQHDLQMHDLVKLCFFWDTI